MKFIAGKTKFMRNDVELKFLQHYLNNSNKVYRIKHRKLHIKILYKNTNKSNNNFCNLIQGVQAY